MALSVPQILSLTGQAISSAAQESQETGVLCFGYPDILLTRAQLTELFGPVVVNSSQFDENCGDRWRWHGMVECAAEPMVDSVSLFHALGATDVTVVDIYPERNIERVVDLNVPLPEDLKNRFHVVLDPGTTEHCFNVGQAIKNIAESVVQGGYLFTLGPLNMYNHGFYSFNPTLYIDFYGENGFDVVNVYGVHPKSLELFDLKTTHRFNDAPAGCSMGAILRKTEVREIVWPTQTKYKARFSNQT